MKSIRLKPGKERSLLRRHPWVFDGAVARGSADPGETVRIDSHEGEFLAWGAYSPASKIRVRAWSFEQAQRIDAAFFRDTLRRAIALRERMGIASNGLRLVHGESDGLPGLVVDRYGDTLVAQFGAAGVERWKDVIADALLDITGCPRLYERSDASARALEGLPEVTGWLRGDGPTAFELQEHGWRLGLDIALGHKTGYYLDQRDSRLALHEYTRRLGFGQVLNCFSYTGGFSVAALTTKRAFSMTLPSVRSETAIPSVGQSSASHPCSRMSGCTPGAMSWSTARISSTETPLSRRICALTSMRPAVCDSSGERLSVQLTKAARSPSNRLSESMVASSPRRSVDPTGVPPAATVHGVGHPCTVRRSPVRHTEGACSGVGASPNRW